MPWVIPLIPTALEALAWACAYVFGGMAAWEVGTWIGSNLNTATSTIDAPVIPYPRLPKFPLPQEGTPNITTYPMGLSHILRRSLVGKCLYFNREE